jgi:ABC-type transport system substrate-binding protein
MSWDRDAYIDTVYNVSKFKSQGLPVDTRWNSALTQTVNYDGWLDPRDKNFGPNGKYFNHDVAEAKKLLAAAGYPNGFEYVSTFPSGNSYGRDFPSQLQILEGFSQEAGLRAKETPIDYVSEFIPKFRNGKGQHDGVAYKIGPGYAYDATSRMVYEYYSKGGVNFYGFDAAGKGDGSGDPQADSLIEKARGELDTDKRRALVQDLQRYLAGKMYVVSWPGGANGFELAWPVIGNYRVYYDTNQAQATYWWVDETKPPIKS